ncbi:MurT ligase domain-containing protein [Caproicibacterium sp. BJN0003]|uniref:MurT ligase domain-containing protein n=1 Tax=Caproicibacterium sp. BJN0003 TaxID=2994078 RepID=UPI002252E7A5|nr:MurT ligase domain-containing protein [Caproicibacterium sp. BJN0003]UZT81532.1 MurT ligase domain-containing protein [Caproicibacterium sp. BJN0003]
MKWLSVKAARLMTALCRKLGRSGSAWPGAAARAVDPWILKKLAADVTEGIIVVTSTNGKTTVNNLLYRALQSQGKRVVCNAEGANMTNGVIAAFLRMADSHGKVQADWATLEVDELFTRKIVKKVQPTYLLINNLVRDQLDRCGELDTVAATIQKALSFSPKTTVLYDADDPLVTYVAKNCGHPAKSFGLCETLGSYKGKNQGGCFCHYCGTELQYHGEHYGRLGDFYCPNCDFARPIPDYQLKDLTIGFGEQTEFSVNGETIQSHLPGIYNVYNVLAAYTAAHEAGVSTQKFQEALNHYHPQNGRMEFYQNLKKPLVLNLIKNPDGTNQAISVVLQDPRPKAVIMIINDHDNDGNDPSWLWDTDIDLMASQKGNTYYACGIRRNDLQVRMKYGGLQAKLCETVQEAINDALSGDREVVYILPNYSALAPTKNFLDHLASNEKEGA